MSRRLRADLADPVVDDAFIERLAHVAASSASAGPAAVRGRRRRTVLVSGVTTLIVGGGIGVAYGAGIVQAPWESEPTRPAPVTPGSGSSSASATPSPTPVDRPTGQPSVSVDPDGRTDEGRRRRGSPGAEQGNDRRQGGQGEDRTPAADPSQGQDQGLGQGQSQGQGQGQGAQVRAKGRAKGRARARDRDGAWVWVWTGVVARVIGRTSGRAGPGRTSGRAGPTVRAGVVRRGLRAGSPTASPTSPPRAERGARSSRSRATNALRKVPFDPDRRPVGDRHWESATHRRCEMTIRPIRSFRLVRS